MLSTIPHMLHMCGPNIFLISEMDNQTTQKFRDWKVLSWNVRGVNSDRKWDLIRSKVIESQCDIICFQETKKENFDDAFLRKICPPEFDKYEFLPSVGASGGCITIWKGNKFAGTVSFTNEFNISIEFTSLHSGAKWVLTNIYAPYESDRKPAFIDCF